MNHASDDQRTDGDKLDALHRMRNEQPANDSPYWPSCTRDPGFLPWLARFLTIVNNTSSDTPTHELVRMARKRGHVPPDWGLAVLFMMAHARSK